jgi:hypothetical protein
VSEAGQLCGSDSEVASCCRSAVVRVCGLDTANPGSRQQLILLVKVHPPFSIHGCSSLVSILPGAECLPIGRPREVHTMIAQCWLFLDCVLLRNRALQEPVVAVLGKLCGVDVCPAEKT